MSKLPVVGNIIKNPIKSIAQAAALATGNAWAVPVIEGGNSLAKGKGLMNSLVDAGLAYGTANLGNSLSSGLSNTAFGRGINDLYKGSFLESAGNSLSSGFNDFYKGSDLASLIGTSGDSVTLPGIGQTNLGNGTGLKGFASDISNSLGLGGSPVSSSGVVSGSSAPSLGGGGASSVGSSEGGMFSNLFSKDNAKYLGLANSMYGNMQAQKSLKNATNQANAALSPYTGIGSAAAGKLQGYLGLGGTPSSTQDILASSPGYQFMLDQGNQQLDRSQAARGGYFSGAALKAAQDYSAGLADQTAQNYYSQLANTAGLGANAAGQYGNNVTALGTARGASDIQTANMINQLLAGYQNPYAQMFGMV